MRNNERPTATTARRGTRGEHKARTWRDATWRAKSPHKGRRCSFLHRLCLEYGASRGSIAPLVYATLRAHKVCRFAPLFSPSERGRTCSRRSPSPDAHVRSHESRGAASPRFFLHLSLLSRPPPCPSCPSRPAHPLARRAIYTCQYSQT